jgi:hypothetical protein
MHRWMHSAAGGTIHLLNPGLATVRSRLRIGSRAIELLLRDRENWR